MYLNDWLVTDDTMLKDYLSRELEYTDKGQIKSSTTNIITVLVNPSYCVKEGIIDGRIFFDTCSRTIRLLGVLKGEKTNGDEIRKWNDQIQYPRGGDRKHFRNQIFEKQDGRCPHFCCSKKSGQSSCTVYEVTIL